MRYQLPDWPIQLSSGAAQLLETVEFCKDLLAPVKPIYYISFKLHYADAKVPLWTNKKFLAQKYLYEQMHSKQKQKGSLFIQSSYEIIIRARKKPQKLHENMSMLTCSLS